MPVQSINDGWDFLIVLLVVIAGWALFLISTALMIWGERRLVAKMQSRIGPNRLGPFGIMQTLADGAKFFFKEDITPKGADKAVYFTAPLVSAIVAMLTFAVIPFGGTFAINDRLITLQIWDPQIGLLWPLAMGSIGVYGIVLAGWSSGSKYPLLGGVRSSAQMISYELAMGLGAAAVFIFTGSLRSSDVVAAQTSSLISDNIPVVNLIPTWNIVPMFPAFLLFFIAAIAETQRPPFDLPEAEGELVAGFHTEYSGAKFAMFFLAEFMNVITMSALVVTMFLGGPSGPVPAGDSLLSTIGQIVLPVLYFVLKTLIFIFVFVWLRATLPRMRYDRLMDLGWKVMLPLGIVWVFLTGLAVTFRTWIREIDQPFTTTLTWLAIIIGIVILLTVLGPLIVGRDPEEADVAADGPGGGGGGGGSRPKRPPLVPPDGDHLPPPAPSNPLDQPAPAGHAPADDPEPAGVS